MEHGPIEYDQEQDRDILDIEWVTEKPHFDPKRIMILMSPATRVDMHRRINILLLAKPFSWNIEDTAVTMDGQCIANPEFMAEYSDAVSSAIEERIGHVFQFRASIKGKLLAKGTVRGPLPGLTSWEEWLTMVGHCDKTWVDVVMDKDTMKVFPKSLTENGDIVISVPGDFFGYHRADDHDSKSSLCGTQMARLGFLRTGQDHHILNKLASGDRESMVKLMKLDPENPLRSKLQRSVVCGLPITHKQFDTLETIYAGKYLRKKVLNTGHRSGSRFLCTDPKIGAGEVYVPNAYLPRLKENEIFCWVSTPIVDEKCVRPIKRRNIRKFDCNVIAVDARMALLGHRDFDGDLTKIINLRKKES